MKRTSKQNDFHVNNNEDISYIINFRKGETGAFDNLVLKYQDSIINLCVRFLGNYADGEDAAQETFVKVYRKLIKFKGEALFSTWLYRIAINTCKNHRRLWWTRLKQTALHLDAPKNTEDGKYTQEIGDTNLSPEKDLERSRITNAIIQALNRLPEKHRELIILRDIDGLRYEEIESVLGISAGTIKSRLVRARSAMQERLKGKIDEA